MIGLRVNGREVRVKSGITLAALLAELDLDPRAVVVERNGAIVSREEFDGTPCGEGDVLEVVRFVGGG